MLIAHLPAYIEDRDLRLRRLRISDGPFISKLLQHDDILISSGTDTHRRTPWPLLYWWLRRTFLIAYCIEHRARTIGFVGLYNIVSGESAEISLVIFDPLSRRRGFGTRAFQLLCGNSFTISLEDTLIAKARRDNEPARAFWTSLGFGPAGNEGDIMVMIRERPSGS
jgi:RimJ/RimL family protein N-acetyltransferase